MKPTDLVFPSNNPDAAKNDPMRYIAGITKRDYIAIEIANGICACPRSISFDDQKAWFQFTPEEIAAQAVLIANTLIAELAK